MIDKKQLQEDFNCILRANACNKESLDVKATYNAFSKAVMANLFKDWEENRNAEKKRCGYFSAEFLIACI